MIKNVFERYEFKYVLTKNQYEDLMKLIKNKLISDAYSFSTIQSLYYDTPNSLLIRTSLEAPLYKEKLRLRAYGKVSANDIVFLEIKKKSFGIVYKRRIPLLYKNSFNCYDKNVKLGDSQIANEIDYFKRFYNNLVPSCLLIYDREAYSTLDDIRITFDHNPRYRTNNFSLSDELIGTSILKNDEVVMEIKINNSIPLWLAKILSNLKIYKSSFSKYGEAYKQYYKKEKKTWNNSLAQYFQTTQ